MIIVYGPSSSILGYSVDWLTPDWVAGAPAYTGVATTTTLQREVLSVPATAAAESLGVPSFGVEILRC